LREIADRVTTALDDKLEQVHECDPLELVIDR
jgi:hypothetical protein